MIVTLTVNPALDRTLSVDRLAFEDRAYIEARHESPGGRGVNAACVIHSFGGKPLAIFPSGGKNGKCFAELLSGFGYDTVAVPTGHEIRTNLTITDRQGLTVSVNERGPQLGRLDADRLEKAVQKNLDGASWLMLCGSLPPGVPSNFYARLIEMARRKKVRTLLDTDGAALREGIEAAPTAVSPNQHEAERLLNRALFTRNHFLEAAAGIRAMGAETVVLSLGSRGALGAINGSIVEAVPPRVEVLCPIGAGDALAAAFVWSMEKNGDFEDALRWGVATGTASAKLPGLRLASLDQATEVYRQVELRRIE
ncbi:MAG TPA: 1-phosphofructokinase family hexose kinase [Bryobacteraceae bacterium]|nr:1-phosphofructokinase family hexose kinase [Bryobacteraceae bacterium]